MPRLQSFALLSLVSLGVYLWIWHFFTLPPFHRIRSSTSTHDSFGTPLHELDLDAPQEFTLPFSSLASNPSPKDHVLILTPMMEAAPFLEGYFQRLAKVDYPKDLISLGFLVSTRTNPSSDDRTLVHLKVILQQLSALGLYRKITLLYQTSKFDHYSHSTRHAYDLQSSRRRVLAECRNTLLSSTLSDESWALWLDVDVIEYSPQLMSQLMAFQKDIIVPNCFRMKGPWWRKKSPRPYDRNNWHETMESLAHQRALSEDDTMFEGKEPLPCSEEDSTVAII